MQSTLAAAFGSFGGIAATIERATPLMLTGLAVVLALRGGFINLGVEGQMIAAAFAALALSGGVVPFPALAVAPFVLIVGVIAGALLAVAVAALKVRVQADEAIVTVLLNVVLLFALQLAAGGVLQTFPPLGSLQSLPMANAADFPGWGYVLRVYLEPVLALGACVLAFGLLHFTIWGLDIRATGGNAAAARFSGIHVDVVTLAVAFLSGGLAGLAGAGEVVRAGPGETATVLVGFGYAGIAVAYLAALEPLGVIPAALFVAFVIGGIDAANHATGVPLALGGCVNALLLVTALIAHSAVRYRLRLNRPIEAQ
jgi:simple sugar transport system permease protein